MSTARLGAMEQEHEGRVQSARALDVSLAEFNALRAEILNRSTAQSALIGLGLTAIGVIFGVVASDGGDESLLLAIPPLAMIVNLIYASETSRIAAIGKYIQLSLWPSLSRQVGGGIPSWEAHRMESISKGRLLVLEAPAYAIFAGSSVAALLLAASSDELPLSVVGVASTVVAIAVPLYSGLVDRARRMKDARIAVGDDGSEGPPE